MALAEDVCVLVPTLDESETIAEVIEGFREQGYGNVLVIDGGSTDGTPEIAAEAGARVVEQAGTGKGQAVREAVRDHVRTPYVLMVDGDGTYRPEDADAMLEPLVAGDAEHVIGNRFAEMHSDAMTRLNYAGNRLINRAFSLVHRRYLADILSGYRAFTRESFGRLNLSADGFGIETQMAAECVKRGVPVEVVPIAYLPRPAGSNANLQPFRDGGVILLEVYRRAKTNNPLFYFGSVGTLSTAFGLAVAGYVGYEWFVQGVNHEILAVLAAFAVLFGVQLLMFGVFSDLLVTLHRERMDELQKMRRERRDADGDSPVEAGYREGAVEATPREGDAESVEAAEPGARED